MNFAAQFINGLNVGSIYALTALGYTMVYGIVKLINFAHGDIIMVSSYVSLYCLLSFGMSFWLAIPVSMVVCALLGVVIEKIAYKPLRNATRISALITAIGVSYLLQNLFLLKFTASPKTYPNVINAAPVDLGGTKISVITILTIVISLILMVLLTLFVRYTKTGKAMRAVSEDAGASTLMGINMNQIISITFAVGSALAAVGGSLYCVAYPKVEPFMGSMLGIKAFVAAVLGGIGVIPGAMIGGFILGIAESLTKGYISSQLSDAVVFGILIVVLLFKPSGLLGKHQREKV